QRPQFVELVRRNRRALFDGSRLGFRAVRWVRRPAPTYQHTTQQHAENQLVGSDLRRCHSHGFGTLEKGTAGGWTNINRSNGGCHLPSQRLSDLGSAGGSGYGREVFKGKARHAG